ncbi:MAG: VCBS repeat-containing protein, partial [Planctomycetota bacterium]
LDTAMMHTLLLLVMSTASPPQGPEFAPAVRLKAGNDFVRVEAPGYAAPCWHDVDGDGKKDLVVGQFKDGKMKFYKNLGAGKLAEGAWIQADGNTAEVPGVW